MHLSPTQKLHLKSLFTQRVLFKWFMAYGFFKLYFEIFKGFIFDFDPSGHLICASLTYASWFQLVLFLFAYKEYLGASWHKLTLITSLLALLLFMNQMHGLVYTQLIYHDVYESIHALIFSLVVSFLTFNTHAFSDALYNIVVGWLLNFGKRGGRESYVARV